MDRFVNRVREMAELDRLLAQGGMAVVFGRRRVGKTRLLAAWCARRGGLYTQAVEGGPETQIAQGLADWRQALGSDVSPSNWVDLLELLELKGKRLPVAIDEFPYLVESDPTLPSRLQRWLDHRASRNVFLLLSGSSTRMMHSQFLDRSAPLYGRATKLIRVEPMAYPDFCDALSLRPAAIGSFHLFSMVGGVPKYWELLGRTRDPATAASLLYFDSSPYMESEPRRLLLDEKLGGLAPMALLEAVGRGASRPSEIASRLGTAQTNLGRLFQQLMDANLIARCLPFGESERSTKRVLYRIADPALAFWFSVFSPHRTRWASYGRKAKLDLVSTYAGLQFEECVRSAFAGQGARRYWEKDVELDLAREPLPRERAHDLVVAEVKLRKIGEGERERLLADLGARFARSALAKKFARPKFEVIGAEFLERLGRS